MAELTSEHGVQDPERPSQGREVANGEDEEHTRGIGHSGGSWVLPLRGVSLLSFFGMNEELTLSRL